MVDRTGKVCALDSSTRAVSVKECKTLKMDELRYI